MIDKTFIIDQARASASPTDSIKEDRWENAYVLAVADLSTRLIKANRLWSYEETISADDRTVVLEGQYEDLTHIFYLLYGTGSEESVLDYIDTEEFLKYHNSSEATAGTPTKFTFIGYNSQNKLQVKFDVPAESSTTLTVYYFKDINPLQVKDSEGPALVNLTKAFFYGSESEAGMRANIAAERNIKFVRADNRPIKHHESKFGQSHFDENIEVTRGRYRNRS